MTKEINWEQIDNMLIAGCNGIQCAAAIGVHHDTLYDRCVEDKKTSFSVYSQQKRAHGDGLLHAAQFQKAYKDKNPTILIWLGKQRLGQKDVNEEIVVVPKQLQIDQEDEIMRLKHENAELKANANKPQTGQEL